MGNPLITPEQAARVGTLVQARVQKMTDVPGDALQRCVIERGGHFQDRVEEIVREMTSSPFTKGRSRVTPGDIYVVEIQPTSLAHLIRLGHYDQVHYDITEEHFPLDPSQFGRFELVLVHPNLDVSTDEALARIEAYDLIPAGIGPLLGFGVMFPNIQRMFPIIALGSSWSSRSGYRDVPLLIGDSSYRALDLHEHRRQWRAACRFLALRKKSA